MILFGLILFLLFLTGLRDPKPSSFNSNIVKVLKPFCAISIVLHHLCVYKDVSYLSEFERWGPWLWVYSFLSRVMAMRIHLSIEMDT